MWHVSFLEYGLARVNVMPSLPQYSNIARFSNSEPLSVSKPRMRNGRSPCSRRNAANTVSARLSRRPAHAT
jgi:hypothetical protein